MNYYERVQRAIDYIEINLENPIDLHAVAAQAYMSLASLYRLFFSMTGFSVKEYIRKRRISEALLCLLNSKRNILDISLAFCFDSQEAFTRSFKQLTGFTPGAARKSKFKYSFERVNIVEKYFDIQDSELLEKYPDIKVIKELKPMRVAYYRHIGTAPENGAWEVMDAWIKKVGLDGENCKMRVFGFDNPSPSGKFIPGVTEYGYEFMVTIDEDMVVDDELVRAKTFEGGRYAVMSISNVDGNGIVDAWKRFRKWIAESKYIIGTHQWLEEQISFDGIDNEVMKMDLYMPLSLRDKNEFESKIDINSTEGTTVAYYRASGKEPWKEAWQVMSKWADKNGCFNSHEKIKFLHYSNIHEAQPGSPGFWYEICVVVDNEDFANDKLVKVKQFNGGLYACVAADNKTSDSIWSLLEKWMFSNGKYTYDNSRQFFQEQWLSEPVCLFDLPASYPVSCCMPIKASPKK